MAKDCSALREDMKAHLAEAVAAGKVLSPTDAHRQLKRKFGHSLSVGEVGSIVTANRPGEKKDGGEPIERPAAKKKPERGRRRVAKKASAPEPGTAKRKSGPRAKGPSTRPPSKSDVEASRQEMKAYLTEQVKAGAVSAPKDAHALLKAKFGRSMSFGVVGAILGANRPGGRKSGATRGEKQVARKPGRPKRSSTPSARSRSSSRNRAAMFAIIAPGHDPIVAGSRREVIDQVTSLVSGGTDSSGIDVFRRLPVRITTSYEIGL